VSPAANTWTDITATFTLSAGFNNLAFIVWTEGTLAQNNRLLMEAAKLEAGGAATDFVPRPVAEELALCQRYLRRAADSIAFINGNRAQVQASFSEMFTVPTFSHNVTGLGSVVPATGTEIIVFNYSTNAYMAVSSVSITSLNETTTSITIRINNITSTVTTGDYCTLLQGPQVRMLFDAEL
jgi:hypothetical protein